MTAPTQTLEGQHTPGHWIAEPADMFGDHNIVRGNSDERLAIAAVVSNLRPEGEVAANACLIAAAPDLLAALKWALPLAVQSMESLSDMRSRAGHTSLGTRRASLYDSEVEQIDHARAAIAKATGK